MGHLRKKIYKFVIFPSGRYVYVKAKSLSEAFKKTHGKLTKREKIDYLLGGDVIVGGRIP
jgi:hypothetical protein